MVHILFVSFIVFSVQLTSAPALDEMELTTKILNKVTTILIFRRLLLIISLPGPLFSVGYFLEVVH